MANDHEEDELRAVVNVDGQPVTIAVADAIVYTDGDFDGNIDMSIGVSPKAPVEALLVHLRARVPGDAASLDAIGSEETESGVDVTFFSPGLRGASSIPSTVALEWHAGGTASLGSVSCRRG